MDGGQVRLACPSTFEQSVVVDGELHGSERLHEVLPVQPVLVQHGDRGRHALRAPQQQRTQQERGQVRDVLQADRAEPLPTNKVVRSGQVGSGLGGSYLADGQGGVVHDLEGVQVQR